MNPAFLSGAAALLLGAALLACPAAAAQGFSEGLALCGGSLLPALFPFFVVCELLVGSPVCEVLGLPLRPLTRLCGIRQREAASVLVLGWVGGYAVCARMVAQLRAANRLTARDASLLLVLGCCSGPGFVIGAVGGQMLGSIRLGVLLYALQLAANLLAGACLLPVLPRAGSDGLPGAVQDVRPTGPAQAIGRAVDSSLLVCGCVLFFRILTCLADELPFLSRHPGWQPWLSGALEISAGCYDFAGLPHLPGLCFCLSVMGFSVFAQLSGLLRGTVSLVPLAFSRGLHLVFLQGMLRIALRFLPTEAAVFSSLAPRVVVMQREAPDTSLAVFFFLCAVLAKLYKVRQSSYNERVNPGK